MLLRSTSTGRVFGAAPPLAERAARLRPWLPRLSLALLAFAVLALVASAAPRHADDLGRDFFGLWRTRHVLLALGLCWVALAGSLAARSPRALQRFVIANASAFCAWLVLEVLGLAGVIDYARIFGASVEMEQGQRAVPNLDVRGVTREDLALLWNLPSERISYHYCTDHRGFRNEPDRESADLYLLGDSYLVAGLLPFSDTLAAQLEARLQRPVMNVALVGLSPQAESQIFRDAHLPLERRLVLHFIFEGNDLLDSVHWRARNSDAPPAVPWTKRSLANQLVERLQLLTQPQPAFVPQRTGWIGETPYRFQWLANSFRNLDSELEPIAECLTEERREVESAGGRYGVVFIPATIRVLGPLCSFAPDSPIADWRAQCGPLPEFLRNWSDREQIAFLDLTSALDDSARAGVIPWFAADTHWNAVGHRVAAAVLAQSPFVREWASEQSRR
jgi:hypothetical protein